MNIMLLANSFFPTHGGRELVVHHLTKSLCELGHDARVVLIGGVRSRRQLSFPYPVHIYPGLGKYLSNRIRPMWYYYDFKKFGADIISAHATYPSGLEAIKLRKKINIPVVITPHGNDIHMIPEIGHGLRLNPKYKAKIEYAVQRADMTTSISKSIEDSLISAGCLAGKIRSIPNGIDIDRFTREHGIDILKWLNIPDNSDIILTVGKYQARKGHEYIVNAMPDILVQHPTARLVIVGQGTEALNPLIEKLGLQGKVLLTGLLKFPIMGDDSSTNKDYLAALYQKSSMYVSCSMSEGAEGLSLAVLDGLASGLPVVATDISGNRDIIINGKNGYLVPPKDALALAKQCNVILSDRRLASMMKDHARQIASSYSWKSVAEQYVSVFREAQESCCK